MPQLFQRKGLENDTGLLRERWDQEGSDLINAYASSSASPLTVRTVTTGKKFMVKQIIIESGTAPTGYTILDNATGKAHIGLTTNDSLVIPFDTPLEFLESFVATRDSGTANMKIAVVGWEEDA